MNERKAVEVDESNTSEDDDLVEQKCNYSLRNNKRKICKKNINLKPPIDCDESEKSDNEFNIDDDDCGEDPYTHGISNTFHSRKSEKNKREIHDDMSNIYGNTDEMDNDDNLSVIVHAVLEELNGMKKQDKMAHHNENERFILFAKEIDDYLKKDHTKRNKYLTNHDEIFM